MYRLPLCQQPVGTLAGGAEPGSLGGPFAQRNGPRCRAGFTASGTRASPAIDIARTRANTTAGEAGPDPADGRCAISGDPVRSRRPDLNAYQRAGRPPVARVDQPPERNEHPGLPQGQRYNHRQFRESHDPGASQLDTQACRPGGEDRRRNPLHLLAGRAQGCGRYRQERADCNQGLPPELHPGRRADGHDQPVPERRCRQEAIRHVGQLPVRHQ